jgi:serine/threonine protein kinase
MDAREMTLLEVLKIALQLSKTLGELHQQQIIHKDITPANILINPAGLVKITDFGIASRLTRETPEITSPDRLEGTLAYMSPEQTGRMNRAVDYRTDFYSLGVTLYEMLTRRLPFQATDPMELVHCHIAIRPQRPDAVRPEIPKVAADLVMKLLAKTAEERYQSAYALTTDLETCVAQLQSSGQIGEMSLGEADVSSSLQMPQKLYGREGETAVLMDAFWRVSRGATEMMLVCGYSGVGKSALVHEIHRPIVQQRGYFISGKFNQLQNVPYAALIQAFQALIGQLLTESSARLAAWKEQLLEALGAVGQVISNVIPEVELIIGKQPAVPQLGPTESQNRFNLVWQNFIGVFG